MNKKLAVIIIGILLVGGIVAVLAMKQPASAPSHSDSMGSTSTEQTRESDQPTTSQVEQTDNVSIKDSAFTPAVITIKKGATVTWTNEDVLRHDIAPDDETDDFKKSKLLAKGESYSVTFNTVGTFTYHCTPHPFMKGTVVVTE